MSIFFQDNLFRKECACLLTKNSRKVFSKINQFCENLTQI
ncbi:hypothetical protein CBDKU1_33010 [Clostridium butyricum DKU-01]|nr:hypothetical protein CBDKU1_33010 [Clostridium butyricum DKU-01]